MAIKSEQAVPANEIVVYQPNETLRLEVKLDGRTVWLSQKQMAELFGCSADNVGLHLKNIYTDGELDETATAEDFSVVRKEGRRMVSRRVKFYNLDAIISVGFRVNSRLGIMFRQWANGIIQDHLLRGYSLNVRMNQLEDKVDRRLAKHDADIVDLKEKVDFFVKTSQPPVQGVFYDGQVFDAHVFAAKHILSAKKSILLIDSWVDVVTLELLAKKQKGVTVEIVASPRGNKLSPSDIATFNAQYGGLTVRTSTNFHDRFVIVDGKSLYLFGASLKDLGRKCFAFTKLDASEIPGLKARV